MRLLHNRKRQWDEKECDRWPYRAQSALYIRQRFYFSLHDCLCGYNSHDLVCSNLILSLFTYSRLTQRAPSTVATLWQRSSMPMGSSTFSLLWVGIFHLSWWLARRWGSGLWTLGTRPLQSSLLMLWQDFQVQV